MRTLLMFDLPVVTAKDRHNYSVFVKFLKKNGFVMFQESIYVKLSINEAAVKSLKKVISNNLPPKGDVAMMTITEKQFSSMDVLVGEFKTDVITTDQRVLEL